MDGGDGTPSDYGRQCWHKILELRAQPSIQRLVSRAQSSTQKLESRSQPSTQRLESRAQAFDSRVAWWLQFSIIYKSSPPSLGLRGILKYFFALDILVGCRLVDVTSASTPLPQMFLKNVQILAWWSELKSGKSFTTVELNVLHWQNGLLGEITR